MLAVPAILLAPNFPQDLGLKYGVRPSSRMATTRPPLDGFLWKFIFIYIYIFIYFRKFIEKIKVALKIRQE